MLWLQVRRGQLEAEEKFAAHKEERLTLYFQFQEAEVKLAQVQEALDAQISQSAQLEADAHSTSKYQQELEGKGFTRYCIDHRLT